MLESGEKEIALRMQPHDSNNVALLAHTLTHTKKIKAKTTFNFFEAI